ncbi:right-handed parallel beta-helix repeat-containing protein [Methanosphaera cuniculi]|uniref:right-handed parallel beta-helix repeat-containing protein n=1 Tax=Methanosphaera cuniculi TaxID=1077256 RepID=UPI0026DA7997|nr:right-handed parallel beta-helix repeat-containing protein [Methanosphaera cuniculi]
MKVTFQAFTIINAKDTNGAAIYNRGTLNLKGMKIAESTSTNGAIYNKASLYITKTSFSSNKAKKGAAIYNLGYLNSQYSTFNKNQVSHLGSAIYTTETGKIVIYANNFTENYNSSVYLASRKDNEIRATQFINNTAVNGAAIYNDGILRVNKTYFYNNKATQHGGAIYNKNLMTIQNSTFTQNYAKINGGAINTQSSAKIIYSKLNENTAKYGGAIFNTQNITIQNDKFNTNHVSDHGGAIFNSVSKTGYVKITNSEFTKNTASLGGGVYVHGKVTITINTCSFNENKNNAIYLKTSEDKNTITNTNFTKNNSTKNGGAIFNEATKLTITRSTFKENGNTDGGAIYNYRGYVTVTNSIFKANKRIDLHNTQGKIIADKNWWETNTKPGSTRAFNVTINNWIYLNLNMPTNTNTTNITTIISLNNLYDGKTITSYTPNLQPITGTYSISGCGVTKTSSITLNNKPITLKTSFKNNGTATFKVNLDAQTTTKTVKIQTSTLNSKITSLFVQIDAKVTASDVSAWKKAGITDVYVQARASTNNVAKLKQVISLCKGTNIRVHGWVICFSTSNGFDISTKQQNMIRNFITKIVKYDGISGICLDYVRYSGTNPSIVDPTKITNFVKSVNQIVKKQSPSLLLSACVFAEKGGTKTYYGQDYAALSPYVDVLLPMAYKYDYNAGRNWLKDVTEYVVKKAKYSKVVTVLQTYKGSSTTKLSKSELESDAKAVMSVGSYGYSLFRYGLISSYPTSAEKLTS